MTIITCTRKINFCAGHRVYGHESRCRNLHGHNYNAFVTAQANSVGDTDGQPTDILGRVIDFSVLKQVIGGWIDEQWDHGFLLWESDEEAIAAVKAIENQRIYVMPINPTAENIGKFLLEVICPKLLLPRKTAVKVVEITVWETENCYATVKL